MKNAIKKLKDSDGKVYVFNSEAFSKAIKGFKDKSEKEGIKLTIGEIENQLAERLNYSVETIRGHKKGNHSPDSIETVYRMADFLGVNNEILLKSIDERNNQMNRVITQIPMDTFTSVSIPTDDEKKVISEVFCRLLDLINLAKETKVFHEIPGEKPSPDHYNEIGELNDEAGEAVSEYYHSYLMEIKKTIDRNSLLISADTNKKLTRIVSELIVWMSSKGRFYGIGSKCSLFEKVCPLYEFAHSLYYYWGNDYFDEVSDYYDSLYEDDNKPDHDANDGDLGTLLELIVEQEYYPEPIDVLQWTLQQSLKEVFFRSFPEYFGINKERKTVTGFYWLTGGGSNAN